MTVALRVSSNGGLERFAKSLQKKKDLPALTSDAMMEWGKILEKDMKNAAVSAGITPSTGALLTKGIRWEQRPKGNIGKLFIYKYGQDLDSMNTHYVSVRASRGRLLQWAAHARSPSIRRMARSVAMGKLKRFGLRVTPHPFIDAGYARARPKLNPILKRYQSRAFT